MTDGPAPRWQNYVAIFLVSAAVMLFQIAVTRVLSVVVWYHFAFLAISMVMLGLGVPGVWLGGMRSPERLLPGSLIASAITVPASIAALLRWGTAAHEASAVWLIAMVLPATLSLGTAVCILLLRAPGAWLSRMYGADLLGACLAALVAIPLLSALPTPHLAASCGLLPLLALALMPARSRYLALPLALGIATLLASDALEVRRSKTYDESVTRPIYEKWTPTARLAVFDESFFMLQGSGHFTWGAGAKAPKDGRKNQYWLEQDGGAGTPIPFFDGDLTKMETLLFDATTIGYQVRDPDRVAVIGAGGGRDVLTALVAGANHVDAIELNEHTIEIVSERFGDVSGDVYGHPKVRAIAAEGRSFLTHSDDHYDLIQISLIDSWAASTAGAFALAENNLYTKEAFALYFERLGERGLLSTSRWVVELPRLIVLARAALEAEGIREPERHLAIVRSDSLATVLLSRSPFDGNDLRRLRLACRARGFGQIYPKPPRPWEGHDFFVELVERDAARLEALGLRSEPPEDDSPYFFQTVSPFSDASELAEEARNATGLRMNLDSSRILYDAMLWGSSLALLLFFLPFVGGTLRRTGDAPASTATASVSERLRGSLFFASIGAGFMLFENLSLQRFVLLLGHPSYATTVILASVLLGMGIGSTFAERFGLRALQRYGLAAALLLGLHAVFVPALIGAAITLPLPARIAAACAILVPTGGLLGLFFPLGMTRFGDANKAWYWAINGAFGVVASTLSLALSMEFGFTFVGAVAAAIYAIAWLCLGSEPSTTLEDSP